MKHLKSNLVSYFILFSVVPLLIGVSVIFYNFYKAKYQSIYDRQYQIFQLVKHDTDSFIENIEFIAERLKEKLLNESSTSIVSVIKDHDNISSILILNNDGILREFVSLEPGNYFKGYDYSNTASFKKIEEGNATHWSEVFLYTNDTPSISYSIRIDDNRIGVIIINLSILNKFANKFKAENEKPIVKIADYKGQFLANPAREEFVYQRKHILDTDIYRNFIQQGKENIHIHFMGMNNKEKIGLYGKTKKQNWYIIVAEDYDRLLKDFNHMVTFTLVFLLFLLVVSIYFSIKLAKSILNPIKSLSLNMNDIANNKFEITIEKPEYIELLDLTNSFGIMQETIKEQTVNLKNKNIQLTEAQKISNLGFWSIDQITKQITWSEEIHKILEVDKDIQPSLEFLIDHIHPDDKDLVFKTYQNALKHNQSYSIRHRVCLQNGTIKWIQEEFKTTFDKEGNAINFLGTLQDISRSVEQERIIQEQSKNAAMGEMIGNIAHQWRQPLSSISSSATSMILENEMGVLDNQQIKEFGQMINKNAQYLSKTIEDFRNLIKGDTQKVVFNLSKNIRSFIYMIEGSIESNQIELSLNLDDTIEINGYPHDLTQCLMNIYNNTKDALAKIESQKKCMFIETLMCEDRAEIRIKDNAGGIAAEVLPKIFEPYFTTKHQSQGTGLGLHMTYKLIVEGMSGTIKADNVTFSHENNEYRGVEFVITI
jgi:signal transduction histidine kinase